MLRATSPAVEMRAFARILFALLAAAGPACVGPAAAGPAFAGPRVAGWVETVWVGDPPFALPARLDTGIDASSIGAGDIVLFDRGGREWVRFVLGVAGGRETTLEHPVIRITVAGSPSGQSPERPVIRMKVCLAGKRAEAEFILADRTGREYPVLIGRGFLQGDILVDPSRAFVAASLCATP